MAEAIATVGNAVTQAVNPLVQDGRKLIPSVTRVFSSKAEMYVYLPAYEPDAPSGGTAAHRVRVLLSGTI